MHRNVPDSLLASPWTLLFITLILTIPAAAQTGVLLDTLARPDLSLAPGFYDTQQIQVSAAHEGQNVVLRYTLDGSEPMEGSPVFPSSLTLTSRDGEPNEFSSIVTTADGDFWSAPNAKIFKANVLRVRAFKEGAIPSPTRSGTYIVGPGVRQRYSLPVVSVLTDREHFFGDENGIYVAGSHGIDDYRKANFWQRGREWERPVHLEIFDQSGVLELSQDAGARIHGGMTRRDAVKSLRFYARSDYGNNDFAAALFPEQRYGSYKRLILRNAGNDNVEALFRDAFMQRLVGHMRFDTQAYRPAIAFINGEYWGIHNLRERYDRRYLARVYGVDADNLDILTLDKEVKEGSAEHYATMIEYIATHGLFESPHYEHIRRQMDVENFIDYNIAHIYVNNTDWPGNNFDFWRLRTQDYVPNAPHGHDGRWRWMVYDMDFGFWLRTDNPRRDPPSVNNLAYATGLDHSWSNPGWATFLLQKLLENDSFRIDFINRFADQLNTAFLPERVLPMIDAMAAVVERELPAHMERHKMPRNKEIWVASISRMRDFAAQRPQYQFQHIIDQFGLAGTYILTVDVSDTFAGRVKVNTIMIRGETAGIPDAPYPWSGEYFLNVPIEIEAIPEPGFRFLRWDGSAETNRMLTKSPQGDLALRAIFEELPPGPFNLEHGDFHFDRWGANEPAGTYPAHFHFFQGPEPDPGVISAADALWTLPYNLASRSRIVGLNERGFAFINTANPQVAGGGYLGSAVLTLQTLGRHSIEVTWTGGTERPNSRVYHVRLQYRLDGTGKFIDLLDFQGSPVEYARNPQAGHSQVIGPIRLPRSVEDQNRLQLRWKYYYIGDRLDPDSGQRSKLRVDDIMVRSLEMNQESPRSIFWERSVDLGGGFKWGGIGHIYDYFYPLVYAYSLQTWMYVVGESESEYYFWDMIQGYWAYTGTPYYPYYYIMTGSSAGGWVSAVGN